MNAKQVILCIVVITAVIAYVVGDGARLLNPVVLQAQFAQAPMVTALVFFLVYVLGTALSLPVTGVLAVVSGMIFGLKIGAPLALVACTCGGTVGYLTSRYLLHDLVQRRFAVQMAVLNKGVKREGAFYLLCLRMVPVIPFWLLNLLCGVTSIGVTRFFLATLLGMLPVTLVLANFGTQLGAVQQFSLAAIFTPELLLSLTLLAALPLLARGVITFLRRVLANMR